MSFNILITKHGNDLTYFGKKKIILFFFIIEAINILLFSMHSNFINICKLVGWIIEELRVKKMAGITEK